MNNTVKHLLQTARGLQQAGELSVATDYCLQAYALAPDIPDTLYFLAVLCAQSHDFSAAEHYFKRAIALDANRPEFYANYSNSLLEQGQLTAAIEQGLKAIQLNANQYQSHNILGNAYLMQGEYLKASQHLRKAYDLNPAYTAALSTLGLALQKQQRYAEAQQCFQQAVLQTPDDPELLYNQAQCLQAEGQIAAAYQSYQALLKRHPSYVKAQRSAMDLDPAWCQPLIGQHLQLRCMQESDSEYLQQCYALPDFMRFYHHALPRYQSLAILAQKLRRHQQLHPFQSKSVDWIIWWRGSDGRERAIGLANLVDIQFPNRRAEFLLGIPDGDNRLGSTGLEASLLIMEFAFNRVQLNKLTSYVYAINPSAQKNTLSLGFKQEGWLREHIVQPETDVLIDMFSNGLTVADFRQNQRLAKLSRRLLARDITRSISGGTLY